jgi:radical SAM-linked protein
VSALKIRIKFRKYGVMKYIGHLDMMRYFQKCIRRAGIDIIYTGGYSPHQVMSFAAPLGVGITSDGEYLDIEVNTTLTSKAALASLNQVMAKGVEILEYKQLPPQAKNAMSVVAAADYLVYLEECSDSMADLSGLIDRFWHHQAEILITKLTKKSERVINIKPLIYELTVTSKPALFMKLSSGSTDNIKPDLVLQAFEEYCKSQSDIKFTCNLDAVSIHRSEVYTCCHDPATSFIPLGELGEDIISL